LNSLILPQHQKAPPLKVGLSGSFRAFGAGFQPQGQRKLRPLGPGRFHLKNKPKGAIFKSSPDYYS